jgi:hypothetical protein
MPWVGKAVARFYRLRHKSACNVINSTWRVSLRLRNRKYVFIWTYEENYIVGPCSALLKIKCNYAICFAKSLSFTCRNNSLNLCSSSVTPGAIKYKTKTTYQFRDWILKFSLVFKCKYFTNRVSFCKNCAVCSLVKIFALVECNPCSVVERVVIRLP